MKKQVLLTLIAGFITSSLSARVAYQGSPEKQKQLMQQLHDQGIDMTRVRTQQTPPVTELEMVPQEGKTKYIKYDPKRQAASRFGHRRPRS